MFNMLKKSLFVLFFIIFGCSQSTYLDIPYHEQVGPSCVPAQVLMALDYYYPDSNYTLAQIDENVGRKDDKWVWFSQALPVLIDEGLDAYYYSASPYQNLTPEFTIRFYGEEDGTVINQVTDWVEFNRSRDYILASSRFYNKVLDWQTVEDEFRKGSVILMIIDINIADKIEELPYSGHGIIITDIEKDTVTFHDSNGRPNLKIEKSHFIKAWNAPGTDNDVIIIRGRL
ncbi:MAG: hypothetical protein ABII01_05640 [Candidatus Woesearchaeota archaeon]